ncbi:MAG: cytochrome c-type biogenesis protein [Gemmatimonadaceae bacterium]
MNRCRAIALSACVLLLSAFVRADAVQTAGRDSTNLEQRTSAVASQLRCPVCQGLSIQDSPSELAQQMRSVVRDQLAAGRTPEEIKRYFTEKYGEWILLEPEPHGFNVLVYILPVVAVIAGAAVVIVAVRRWSSPAPS